MKKAVVAAVLSLGLFSSCLGPNTYFNKFHDWNQKVTENKWGNAAIFFVLVPIHSLVYLGDLVIFNTIDFWKGGEGKKM